MIWETYTDIQLNDRQFVTCNYEEEYLDIFYLLGNGTTPMNFIFDKAKC